MNSTTWTPPQLALWIKTELERRGFEGNLRLESELLVAFGLKINRLDIFLQFDRPLNESERAAVRSLVRRRFNHEPIAYILGDAHFWDLTLQVGPGVLIPRSDTEVLVEYLTERYPGDRPIQAIEFGIGSGAISLAWACASMQVTVDGLEISPEAFHWAKLNLETYRPEIEANGSSVNFHLDRTLASFNEPIDLLVSNPPYITKDEMSLLSPSVKSFEPELALHGGDDGLYFYRLLFQEGLRLLRPQGILLLEHGHQQKDALLSLMPAGYQLSHAQQDLSHCDRLLAFQRLGEPL